MAPCSGWRRTCRASTRRSWNSSCPRPAAPRRPTSVRVRTAAARWWAQASQTLPATSPTAASDVEHQLDHLGLAPTPTTLAARPSWRNLGQPSVSSSMRSRSSRPGRCRASPKLAIWSRRQEELVVGIACSRRRAGDSARIRASTSGQEPGDRRWVGRVRRDPVVDQVPVDGRRPEPGPAAWPGSPARRRAAGGCARGRGRRGARRGSRPSAGRTRSPTSPRRAPRPGAGGRPRWGARSGCAGRRRAACRWRPRRAGRGPGGSGRPRRRRCSGVALPLLERLAQPVAQLGAGLLGEGDGGDAGAGRRPEATSATTRSTRAVVLPEPAPASTNSVVSRSVRMRSRAAWSTGSVVGHAAPSSSSRLGQGGS